MPTKSTIKRKPSKHHRASKKVFNPFEDSIPLGRLKYVDELVQLVIYVAVPDEDSPVQDLSDNATIGLIDQPLPSATALVGPYKVKIAKKLLDSGVIPAFRGIVDGF